MIKKALSVLTAVLSLSSFYIFAEDDTVLKTAAPDIKTQTIILICCAGAALLSVLGVLIVSVLTKKKK